MLERFLPRIEFTSYEDFAENYRVNVPENFNFGFDVVDEFARLDPEKPALVWCDEAGREASFTFAEMSANSNRVANIFRGLGIGKGDVVMLILRRSYEYWFCLLALHKIGAVAIPATHLLTKKDIVYRCNAADIKMIVSVNEDRVLDSVDEAHPDSPTLQHKLVLNGERPGWMALNDALPTASPDFPRPTGAAATCNDDMMLLYFTSGTTGMPKMVQHDYT